MRPSPNGKPESYCRSNKMSCNAADTARLYLLMFIYQGPVLFSANIVLHCEPSGACFSFV